MCIRDRATLRSRTFFGAGRQLSTGCACCARRDKSEKFTNDLAHFHGEISPNQRDQLHFCVDWLERQRQAVLDAFQVSADIVAPRQENISLPGTTSSLEPAEEEISIRKCKKIEPTLSRDDKMLSIWMEHTIIKWLAAIE